MTPASLNLLTTDLAQTYTAELRKLITKLDWPASIQQRIVLEVSASLNEAKFSIIAHLGPNWERESIKGATLTSVMAEALRRFNYQDQEDAKIASSLVALPAPEPEAEEAKAEAELVIEEEE